MKFIDECQIEVSGGKGGDGIISFRREAKVPRGGPDGGDGGNGGSVLFTPDYGVNTLLNVKHLQHIRAQDGENGRPKNQYGASGRDTIIKVPYGTLVYVKDQLMYDITADKQYLIAKGGKGGRGNTKFKSAKNTVPKLSENGLPGQSFKLHLVLKVLADVGFIGKPSAGKSTLLSVISNAKPKIADYDFTTLTPQLGLVKVKDQSFVAADLPGLIEGASLGKGLGHEFLKHIERCRVVAHIIDFGSAAKDPVADYHHIRQELSAYSTKLGLLPEIVVANKQDLSAFEAHLATFKHHYPKVEIVPISALTQTNLELLRVKLMELLNLSQSSATESGDLSDEITIDLKPAVEQYSVKKISAHRFEVLGPSVKKLSDLIPLNSLDNFNRFNYKLKTLGVWKELIRQGVKTGDIVKIYNYELEWNADEQLINN